jgi:hypothetical protein
MRAKARASGSISDARPLPPRGFCFSPLIRLEDSASPISADFREIRVLAAAVGFLCPVAAISTASAIPLNEIFRGRYLMGLILAN